MKHNTLYYFAYFQKTCIIVILKFKQTIKPLFYCRVTSIYQNLFYYYIFTVILLYHHERCLCDSSITIPSNYHQNLKWTRLKPLYSIFKFQINVSIIYYNYVLSTPSIYINDL